MASQQCGQKQDQKLKLKQKPGQAGLEARQKGWVVEWVSGLAKVKPRQLYDKTTGANDYDVFMEFYTSNSTAP